MTPPAAFEIYDISPISNLLTASRPNLQSPILQSPISLPLRGLISNLQSEDRVPLLNQILNNNPLISAFWAWFLAQAFKFAAHYRVAGKIDFRLWTSSGGHAHEAKEGGEGE